MNPERDWREIFERRALLVGELAVPRTPFPWDYHDTDPSCGVVVSDADGVVTVAMSDGSRNTLGRMQCAVIPKGATHGERANIGNIVERAAQALGPKYYTEWHFECGCMIGSNKDGVALTGNYCAIHGAPSEPRPRKEEWR